MKIPSLPPQTTRAAVDTQTLSGTHTPLVPCLGSVGSMGVFAGTGLLVKEGATGNSSSRNSNSLSITNISASFVNSVPDPGGSGGQSKNVESMSPPANVGHEVPVSPMREYHEVQSLWVKIDLSFLSRVPGQDAGERVGDGSRAERQKLTKGERQEEDNEQLVKDRERQGDRDRSADRERQTDREDRDRFAFGERERARDRERTCQGLGAPNHTPVQDQSNPSLGGRAERVETGGKHRRQAAASMMVPTEKHNSKNKRKHKVGISS